uniref:Uncharacterized protein n=1 Tax=Oncorhynchus tshawytscha TaxID=74940 RepID=A0A8C8JEV0_ONCTS
MLTMGSESPQAIARLFAWVNGISKCELIELKDLSLNDRTELAPEPPAAPPPAAPLTPRQVRDSQRSSQVVQLVVDSVRVEGPSLFTGQGGKGHDFQPCSYTQITCLSCASKYPTQCVRVFPQARYVHTVLTCPLTIHLRTYVPVSFFQNRDGSYTGFIRVLFKLTRPVSLPPPWKASSPQESGQLDGGMKCRTSFYLPKDTAKHLHIGSRTQVREVIEALNVKTRVSVHRQYNLKALDLFLFIYLFIC